MIAPPNSRFSLRLGTVGFSFVTALIFGVALILGIADIGLARIARENPELDLGVQSCLGNRPV